MNLLQSRTVLLICLAVAMLSSATRTQSAGTGLMAQYFDNPDFTGFSFSRVDPCVDFDWGTAAPTNSMGSDSFSVLWQGQVEAAYSELYFFYVTADDGFRLWVDNRLVMARTVSSPANAELSGRIALEAGRRYNLCLQFFCFRHSLVRLTLIQRSDDLARDTNAFFDA